MRKGKQEFIHEGIAASPGIAIGSVLIIGSHPLEVDIPKESISPTAIRDEMERFQKALDDTKKQIIGIQGKAQDYIDDDELAIFDAHLLIVGDQMLIKETNQFIERELVSADYAFTKTIQKYMAVFAKMSDQYMKERGTDIEDVAVRVLNNLKGEGHIAGSDLPGQRVIVAQNLTPSATVLLDKDNVQGFIVGTGNQTSHSAIIAKSMKIPAVVGLLDVIISGNIHNGDLVIVDGFNGKIIINPKEETQNEYLEKEVEQTLYFQELLKETNLPAESIDSYEIHLAANIETPNDITEVINYGASGVGLFRTEYLYLNTIEPPSEENQFKIYSSIAKDLKGKPVIIRTMDIGGDKLSSTSVIHSSPEQNPFLGSRAIRLCLLESNIDYFKEQIRAILRASVFGDIKILFPMISCVEEIDRVLDIIDELKIDLRDKEIDFNEDIEIGVMIETPSAVMLADVFAEKVDFFSIGTNDLIQYTLAVDRSNEKVAYLYQPSNPAIIKLISLIVKAAKRNRIWVSLCGAMAGDPLFTPILVGLGIHELSMSPGSIGPVKRIIRNLKMHEVEKLAADVMECSSAEESLELSKEYIKKIAPNVLEVKFDS